MIDPASPVPPDQTTQNTDVSAQPQPTPVAVPAPGAEPPGAAVPPLGAEPPGAALTDAPGPAPARRSNGRAWVLGGVAIVIALTLVGVVITALSTEPTGPAPGTTSSAPTRPVPTTAVPAAAAVTAAPAVYHTPTKSDFTLRAKILRKQCFGSAGCNITYRIEVTYTGDGDLDPAKTYEVTYQVKGAEDPIINTFEVTGNSASVQQEETASTRRSGDKLTAVVTDVSEL